MEPADVRTLTGPLVLRAGVRSQWHVLAIGLALLLPVPLAWDDPDVVSYLAAGVLVPVGLLVIASVLVPRWRPRVEVDASHLRVRTHGRERRVALTDVARVAPRSVGSHPIVQVETWERQRLSRRRWWFTTQGLLTIPDVFPMPPDAIAREIGARVAMAQGQSIVPPPRHSSPR